MPAGRSMTETAWSKRCERWAWRSRAPNACSARPATRIGKQAYDRLARDVPEFVQEEMRKARSQLLDLKLKGNDLAKPIGILKGASASVKQENWAEALRQLRSFYKDIERIG